MSKKELIDEYRARQEHFKRIEQIAKYQLYKALKSQIKVHSLQSRIKSFDSFLEKAKSKNLKDPFNQVKDLVGLRIVCLFLSDLKKVGEIIKHTFRLISEEDKIDKHPKDVFGYMDIQYIVALRNTVKLGVESMQFEIQVRTIAQDAWASVSHELYYKKEDAIPKEWERDFYALSALFYVADQHFKMLH
jgi:putative GTP pyrophosphokinase